MPRLSEHREERGRQLSGDQPGTAHGGPAREVGAQGSGPAQSAAKRSLLMPVRLELRLDEFRVKVPGQETLSYSLDMAIRVEICRHAFFHA